MNPVEFSLGALFLGTLTMIFSHRIDKVDIATAAFNFFGFMLPSSFGAGMLTYSAFASISPLAMR
jgi:hypothetical protein